MTYNVLCISNNVTYKINYFLILDYIHFFLTNVTYKINYFLILDYIHFFLTKIDQFDPNLNHCMQKDNNMKLIDILRSNLEVFILIIVA